MRSLTTNYVADWLKPTRDQTMASLLALVFGTENRFGSGSKLYKTSVFF